MKMLFGLHHRIRHHWHRWCDRRWCRRKRKPVTKFTIYSRSLDAKAGDETMQTEIYPDGKGIEFTAVSDNPLLEGEKPVWTPSDTTKFSVDYDPADPSGLKAIGKPLGEATGLTATITLTENSGAVITAVSAPFDIIPHPTEPGSFVITEAAL